MFFRGQLVLNTTHFSKLSVTIRTREPNLSAWFLHQRHVYSFSLFVSSKIESGLLVTLTSNLMARLSKSTQLESLMQKSCFPGPNSYRGIFWCGQLMCLQLGKSRIGVNGAVFEQLVNRQVDFHLTKIFGLKFRTLSVVSWRCNHQMTWYKIILEFAFISSHNILM